MLNDEQMNINKVRICELLLEIERDGVGNLILWLSKNGFFDSPCSTKYHGAYAGGLAKHSLDVFGKFVELTSNCDVHVPADSAVIAGLLHDVCKVGAYVGDCAPYDYNVIQPPGHGLLSICRLSEFIELTELERELITYHMGAWYTEQHRGAGGEYPLYALMSNWGKTPALELFSMADQLVTLEEKAAERFHIAEHGSLAAFD